MQTFWKIVSVTLFVTFLALFLVTFSMYWWPGIPSSPRPQEGRVYPLNNHGHYTYMNKPEHDLRDTARSAMPVLFVGFALIQFLLDPFEYKKKRQAYHQE